MSSMYGGSVCKRRALAVVVVVGVVAVAVAEPRDGDCRDICDRPTVASTGAKCMVIKKKNTMKKE